MAQKKKKSVSDKFSVITSRSYKGLFNLCSTHFQHTSVAWVLFFFFVDEDGLLHCTARQTKMFPFPPTLKLLMQLRWARRLQRLPSGSYTVTCIQESDPPKLFYCGPLGFCAEAAGLSASLRAPLQQRRAGFVQWRHLRVSPSVNSRIWDCNLWILWTFLPHSVWVRVATQPLMQELFQVVHYFIMDLFFSPQAIFWDSNHRFQLMEKALEASHRWDGLMPSSRSCIVAFTILQF